MTAYSIALFIHVLGALALFAALGLEWVGLLHLRRAATAEQARAGLMVLRVVPRLAIPALAAILLPGLYMTEKVWGWSAGWPAVALAALALIAVLGAALTGPRMAAVGRAMAESGDPLPPATRHRLRDPLLRLSARTRTAIAVGVVFLMTIKPDTGGSLLTIGVAALVGIAWALPLWRRVPALEVEATPDGRPR